MKIIVVVLIVTISSMTYAAKCGQNEFEYKGECQADIKPISAQPVQPSDEKPPTDKMPSYEREGIKVIEAQNMANSDVQADIEKFNADEEGKRAAGIKVK